MNMGVTSNPYSQWFQGNIKKKAVLAFVKGRVHPTMKITPWFTHPQANLCVHDFLLSDDYNQSYITKCPGSSELYNGREWVLRFRNSHPS